MVLRVIFFSLSKNLKVDLNCFRGFVNGSHADPETGRGLNPYPPVEVEVQGRSVSINPFIPEEEEMALDVEQ
jgi:hypothetical protein